MRRLLWFALLLSPSLAAAQAPGLLGYQGRLMKSDGTPESGVVQVKFSLFAAETGGSALWSEEQSLALSDGYYATTLGAVAALPAGLFDGSASYVEVSVGGSALSPRHRVASVPYALAASAATSVKGGPVDATSLKVGGKDIVDGTGKLAAPVEWSQLSGVPSGFADGADDVGVTSVTVSAPLLGDGSSGKPLSLPAASAGNDGYLAKSDFVAFSEKLGQCAAVPPLAGAGTSSAPLTLAKAGAGSDGYLSKDDFAAFAGKLGQVSAGAPLTGAGTAASPLVIGKASASADGYLAKEDFASFAGKLGALNAGSGIAINGSTVALANPLTIPGKITFGGDVLFGSQATSGLRLETAASEPVSCDQAHAGYVYVNSSNGTVNLCNGIYFMKIASTYATSCAGIKEAKPNASSGIYAIDPDGIGSLPPFSVYCDMDPAHDGGGWTLVLQSSSSSAYTFTHSVWSATTAAATNVTDATKDQDMASLGFYVLRAKESMLCMKNMSYCAAWDHAYDTPRNLANGSGGAIPSTQGASADCTTFKCDKNSMPKVMNDSCSPSGSYARAWRRWGYINTNNGWGGHVRVGVSADNDSSDSEDTIIGLGLECVNACASGSVSAPAHGKGSGFYLYSGWAVQPYDDTRAGYLFIR